MQYRVPTFNRVTIPNILSDLHNKKITVVVPQAAIYSDAELTVQNEPTLFMDNAPVKNKRSMGNEVTYTGIIDNIVNDELKEASRLNKIKVRLPLSTVIDLFHKQYSIYVPKADNDLKKLIEYMDDILYRLENSSDKRAPELFEYIDEFYNTVLKNQKEAIVRKFTTFDNAPKGAKPIAGFSKGLLEERDVNAATFIDLDSVIVK